MQELLAVDFYCQNSGGFSPAKETILLNHHRPSEADIMAAARRALQDRIKRNGGPRDWTTPLVDPVRSARSRQSCHRFVLHQPRLEAPPRDSGAYVPEMAESIDRDRNLSDGARRCARILAAYTYRRDRESRATEITVSYLQKALGKCRRTVQRYLRQLERTGYISVHVVPSSRTRMCVGLLIELLAPLFPRHHREKWPGRAVIADVTAESQNKRFRYKQPPVPVLDWSLRCMEGVWRSFQRHTVPLPQLLPSF
jgi:response regulator of citrate/malate metabolism